LPRRLISKTLFSKAKPYPIGPGKGSLLEP
jgi:hypothetical protein